MNARKFTQSVFCVAFLCAFLVIGMVCLVDPVQYDRVWQAIPYVGFWIIGAAFTYSTFTWRRLVNRRLSNRSSLRLRRISAELSLLVFTLNGMASYLAEYPSIYTSRQWIHVFVGILVGRVIGAVRSVFNRPSQLTCLGLGVLVAMISILNVTALTALKGMPRFQYRGETRLSGAFLDPNMLGLLMGCGLVLALGCAALISEGDERPFGWAKPKCLKEWGLIAILLVVGIFMFVTLLMTYSRGAWAGTACGIIYFLAKISIGRLSHNEGGLDQNEGRLILFGLPASSRRYIGAVVIVGASVMLLFFWGKYDTDHLLLRRLVSVLDSKDFSIINRFASYMGALQMVHDNPLIGFRDQIASDVYGYYYSSVWVFERLAIRTNSYMYLMIIIGLPGLVFIGIYLWNMICGGDDLLPERSKECGFRLFSTYQACAITLLIGFFFNGGLFTVTLGVMFWVCGELGTISVRTLPELNRCNVRMTGVHVMD